MKKFVSLWIIFAMLTTLLPANLVKADVAADLDVAKGYIDGIVEAAPTVEKYVFTEELAEQELILMEASAPYSLQFQHFLSQRHLDCAPFLRLQSADTARRLVEQEASFLSVLPLYTVQKSVQEGKLCVLRIPGWQYTQSVQLVLHRNKALTPQIEGFLRELRLVLGVALSRRLFQERS